MDHDDDLIIVEDLKFNNAQSQVRYFNTYKHYILMRSHLD